MDFFQGSMPPKFIPFCLDKQQPRNLQISGPSKVVPDEAINQQPRPDDSGKQPDSPSSGSSEFDVNAYATAKVKLLEKVQPSLKESDEQVDPNSSPKSPENQDPDLNKQHPIQPPGQARASTPIKNVCFAEQATGLTSLESALKVVTPIKGRLPELQLIGSSPSQCDIASFLQPEDDTVSLGSDAPPLPKEKIVPTFHTDVSEGERTTQSSSQPGCSYSVQSAAQPRGGGITGSEEQGSDTLVKDSAVVSDNKSQVPDTRELSGRSRGILKRYFEETPPFSLPMGHPTVAFSEPQLYHLLRVLTDETVNLSFTTMEKLVIEAVKGKPATAQSRTDHFRIKGKTQSLSQPLSVDSSEEGSGAESNTESNKDDTSDNTVDTDDQHQQGVDTDSAGELALIEENFRKASMSKRIVSASPNKTVGEENTDADTSNFSSQDKTLASVKDDLLSKKDEQAPKAKRLKRERKAPQRGVPMREEFFSKIGWTRSFISGPADPLHNPYMVWCHICKKNISIRTKGVDEILRHHRTEKHLRKDQRWRYEHLRSVDPVRNRIHHRVRGRTGKVLTKFELAKELPLFIHAELVDIGERFPFYEDFLKGSTTALVTPDSRAKTQLCIIADFIQHQGDILLLRNLWSRIGSYTNHQAVFCDFDWSEERLTVSIITAFIRPIVI